MACLVWSDGKWALKAVEPAIMGDSLESTDGVVFQLGNGLWPPREYDPI